MKFVSTRGFSDDSLCFADVITQGLAPDGGLFIPTEFPKIPAGFIQSLIPLSYPERLAKVLSLFEIGIDQKELSDMCHSAYTRFEHEKICPMVPLNEKNAILELFWGPTASFKDMALQMTPELFAWANRNNEDRFCVLAATSGDTGIAAIEGFRKIRNVSVVVLYPKNGVSALQEMQMRSVEADNVMVVAVESDFDLCQTTVKKLFADRKITEALANEHGMSFTAANSMNWGRLLPQVGYYFSAYADLIASDSIAENDFIEVCVPSGNFGNLLAGYIAKQMGLPISHFICASNENNILTEFFQTGLYSIADKKLIPTDSPSIDILISSNIERLLFLVNGQNPEQIKTWFAELSTTGSFQIPQDILETLQKEFSAQYTVHEQMQHTIREVFDEYQYLLDPHTAVAVHTAKNTPQHHFRLIAATAHYQKFAPAIAKVFGWEGSSIKTIFENLKSLKSSVPEHPTLASLPGKKWMQNTECKGNYEDIATTIVSFLEKQ